MAVISATLTALKEVWVAVSIKSPFNSSVWPLGKPDRSWRTTMDGCKLPQVEASPVATVPGVVSLLEQITAAFRVALYVTSPFTRRTAGIYLGS